MELKECRRRMACPYSRVLCPPLCAACRGSTGRARVTTCRRRRPRTHGGPRGRSATTSNLFPTSGIERRPQGLRSGRDDPWLEGGGGHTSPGGVGFASPNLSIRSCNQPLPQKIFFLYSIRKRVGYRVILPEEDGENATLLYRKVSNITSTPATAGLVGMGRDAGGGGGG